MRVGGTFSVLLPPAVCLVALHVVNVTSLCGQRPAPQYHLRVLREQCLDFIEAFVATIVTIFGGGQRPSDPRHDSA